MCRLRGCRHLLLAFLRLYYGVFQWFGTAHLCIILFPRIHLLLFNCYKRDLVHILGSHLNWSWWLVLSISLLCLELFDCWIVLHKGGRNWICLSLFCKLGSSLESLWRWSLVCCFSKVLTKELIIENFFDPLACWIMNPLLSHLWSWSLLWAERNTSLLCHALGPALASKHSFFDMSIGTWVFSSFYKRIIVVFAKIPTATFIKITLLSSHIRLLSLLSFFLIIFFDFTS